MLLWFQLHTSIYSMYLNQMTAIYYLIYLKYRGYSMLLKKFLLYNHPVASCRMEVLAVQQVIVFLYIFSCGFLNLYLPNCLAAILTKEKTPKKSLMKYVLITSVNMNKNSSVTVTSWVTAIIAFIQLYNDELR